MDDNYNFDLVVNNLNEVLNRMVLDATGKIVRIMFEEIRTKIMFKHETKITGVAEASWPMIPYIL